jgi:hypothetical protein
VSHPSDESSSGGAAAVIAAIVLVLALVCGGGGLLFLARLFYARTQAPIAIPATAVQPMPAAVPAAVTEEPLEAGPVQDAPPAAPGGLSS